MVKKSKGPDQAARLSVNCGFASGASGRRALRRPGVREFIRPGLRDWQDRRFRRQQWSLRQ